MIRRMKRFHDFRKQISHRAKHHFDMLLSQRGYVGKITFDHKTEQLHIKVSYLHNSAFRGGWGGGSRISSFQIFHEVLFFRIWSKLILEKIKSLQVNVFYKFQLVTEFKDLTFSTKPQQIYFRRLGNFPNLFVRITGIFTTSVSFEKKKKWDFCGTKLSSRSTLLTLFPGKLFRVINFCENRAYS